MHRKLKTLKYLEILSRLVPLISLVVVFVASCKVILFYSIFNIPIVEYIGVTEYLPMVFVDLQGFIFQLFIGLFGFLVGVHFERKSKAKPDGIESGVKKIKRIRIFNIILLSLLLIGFGVKIYANWPNLYEAFELSKKVHIFSLMLIVIIMATIKMINRLSMIVWFICLIGGMVTLDAYSDAYSDAYLILENRNERSHELYLSEEKIETNQELKYIGRSNEYFFLYDLKSGKSIIRNNAEVKRTVISKKITAPPH